MTERAHDAPNGPEQAKKRRAADGDRQQDEARFELQRFLGNCVLERAFHMLHPLERDVPLAPVAVSILQASIELEAAGLVNHEQWATFCLYSAVEDVQDGLLCAKLGVEEVVKLFGAA